MKSLTYYRCRRIRRSATRGDRRLGNSERLPRWICGKPIPKRHYMHRLEHGTHPRSAITFSPARPLACMLVVLVAWLARSYSSDAVSDKECTALSTVTSSRTKANRGRREIEEPNLNKCQQDGMRRLYRELRRQICIRGYTLDNKPFLLPTRWTTGR